jgi:hypothetical protein
VGGCVCMLMLLTHKISESFTWIPYLSSFWNLRRYLNPQIELKRNFPHEMLGCMESSNLWHAHTHTWGIVRRVYIMQFRYRRLDYWHFYKLCLLRPLLGDWFKLFEYNRIKIGSNNFPHSACILTIT